MKVAALVVAAGRGTRVTGANGPKQYISIGGDSVLARAMRIFASHPRIDMVQVVIHADDGALYRRTADQVAAHLPPPVFGGATRQESVRAGLEALSEHRPDLVLIHDAARPFTSPATVYAVIEALAHSPAALAAQPVTDTLKRCASGGKVEATIARETLWRAQTPQAFRFNEILGLHRRAAEAGRCDFTDDAALAEWGGLAVQLVPAEGLNMKITTQEDVEMAEALLSRTETRIGQGFDVHRFIEGDHVWLCGVRVPHDHGLEGHSDADVGLHALTDALLGAIGDGDIGQHFPPSDPQWRGAASHLFLSDAARRTGQKGGRIVNVDVTLLCEAPRIAPHREAMRARIAEILGIGIDRVGVKATTTERLGFPGRREGMAAMAVASVSLPIRDATQA